MLLGDATSDRIVYLAREENVCFADDFVVQNEKQTKDEERRILQDDVDQDGPHVHRATDVLGRVTAVVHGVFDANFGFPVLWIARGQYHGELQQTPRPDGQNDDAQHSVAGYLVVLCTRQGASIHL